MKSIVTWIALLALWGCQSTPSTPKNIVKIESHEELMERGEAQYLLEISEKNSNKTKLDLAMFYHYGFEAKTRKKAIPLLQRLLNQHDKEGIAWFAQVESVGSLGYVSEAKFQTYYDLIKEVDSEKIELYENDKAANQKLVSAYYDELKIIYDKNYFLCEQPLYAVSNSKLKKGADNYLSVMYFMTCLKKYSVRNSVERFKVLADIEKLNCQVTESRKICISKGYEALSSGEISEEALFPTVGVIRNVYSKYKKIIKPPYGVGERSASSLTTQKVQEAYSFYEREQHQLAIKTLEEFVNQTSQLSNYDKAYINRFLATLFADQDNYKKAIRYALEAYQSNELVFKVHIEVFELLANLYALDNQYMEYIDLMGNYILKHQKSMDLLPKENLTLIVDKLRNG